jgi:hypothetical protein
MLFVFGALFLILGIVWRSWRLLRRAVVVLYLGLIVASSTSHDANWLAWLFTVVCVYQIGICGLAVLHLWMEYRTKSTRGRQLLLKVARLRNHHDVWFTDLV